MDQKDIPVFIKIDDYKDVVDVIHLIREKLKEAHEQMGKIDELRRQESQELGTWRSDLAEIERNLDDADKMLFQP